MKNINDEKYGRLTVLLLIAWLALSITASAFSLFHAGSKHAVHPPLPLGLAVIMPVTQPDSDLCRATPDGFTRNLNCSGCTLASTARDRNGSPYYSGFSAVGVVQSRGPPWQNGNQLTRQQKILFVQ